MTQDQPSATPTEGQRNGWAAPVGAVAGAGVGGALTYRLERTNLLRDALAGAEHVPQALRDGISKAVRKTGMHDAAQILSLGKENIHRITIHKNPKGGIEHIEIIAKDKLKRKILSADLPEPMLNLLQADKDGIIEVHELPMFLKKLEQSLHKAVMQSAELKAVGNLFGHMPMGAKAMVVGTTAVGAVVGGSVLNAVFQGNKPASHAARVNEQRTQTPLTVDTSPNL